ncbi:MAG: T9SS type A sorting domain-containing protein [Bacteroidales bacterium]|nr:T9SS type A sorting domain-containing protein [Bacteroidales bacterium]
MHRKLLIFAIIFLLFHSKGLLSQGLLGGEIRWDCIPASNSNTGKFIFFLKVYQACYNDTAANPVLNSNQIMQSTSPVGNRTMTLLAGYPKDLSPICNPDTSLSQTGCGIADSISAFNGAYRIYIYTDTFAINGTPPYNGWTFSWNGGKRNRSSNLVDSLNPTMRLRSLMYPYGTLSTYPCFDYAPESAEAPIIMTCNGYSFNYTSATRDRELDSISFSWGPVQDSSGSNVSFTTNHSYLNPLPNNYDNPNNINATVNYYTGAINLTSYTEGGFFANQSYKVYKCGIKVAEIYRDMYFQFFDCDSNVSPNLIPPFANLTIVDSVYAGERISFNINFVDSQFIMPGILQRVHMLAYGSQFGTYIPASAGNSPIFDTISGCINPPCATLNAATTDSLPLFDTAHVSTHFSWQTNCGHLATNIGCGNTNNTYNFYFKYWDDYCPVPAYNMGHLAIVVLPKPCLAPPNLDSLAVDSLNGDVQLFWHPVKDTLGFFIQYSIFSSAVQNGFYTQIDTVSNINDTTYLHQGVNALNQKRFYYLRTESGCSYYLSWSPTSDTLHNNYTPPIITDLSLQKLWNPYTVPNNRVWALIKNIGNTSVDSIDFSYYQPDSTLVLEHWIGHLLPGDSAAYKFIHKFIPSANPAYQLCVKAEVVGDADTTNNYRCIQTSLSMEDQAANYNFKLLPNIPNPASEITQLRFQLPEVGIVQLHVFDISGRMLVQKVIEAKVGENGYTIDVSNFENGVYFYQLSYQNLNLRSKFIVLR